MAVQKIEQYRQKNGDDILKVILKPTKSFSQGSYFYCDSEDEDLVKAYTWRLHQCRENTYVEASRGGLLKTFYKFHRELAYKYLDYYPEQIEHINRVEFDNVDSNLNKVNNQQNAYNKPTKGYYYHYNKGFISQVKYNHRALISERAIESEVEICELVYLAETDFLRLKMQEDYYMYDFLKDRRNDLGILDLERTGVISEEEAIYRHVMKYADNAWYYLRYNLEQYFKENHIPVPSYDLDEQGFMIDKITRKRLCPFN